VNKNINLTLFGYGITTKAIAKHYGPATFYDDKVTKPFTDETNNTLKPSDEFNPKYSSLEVPSPGMPPYHPLIQSAQNLISEYDLFLGNSYLLNKKGEKEISTFNSKEKI